MTEELKAKLKTLYGKYESRISNDVTTLEKKITEELKAELDVLLKGTEYVDCEGMYDGDDAITEMAELYVNNAITESSIDNDPSADWDGSNRVPNFAKYLEEAAELHLDDEDTELE